MRTSAQEAPPQKKFIAAGKVCIIGLCIDILRFVGDKQWKSLIRSDWIEELAGVRIGEFIANRNR